MLHIQTRHTFEQFTIKWWYKYNSLIIIIIIILEMFQRIGLSVAIQRFNSVCFCHSFGKLPAQFFDQPRHTWSFTICINFFDLENCVPRAYKIVILLTIITITMIITNVIRPSQMISGYRPAFRCGQRVWGFEACPSLHQRLDYLLVLILAPSIFEIAWQPMKTWVSH